MKCKKCNEEIVGGFWENNGLVCGHCHIAKPMLALRDQFAIAALQGLIASDKSFEGLTSGTISKMSYLMADAMLAEREKK